MRLLGQVVVARMGQVLPGMCTSLLLPPPLAPDFRTWRPGPLAAAPARSNRSTSSSFNTACLPCLRIQLANFGSASSMASANSLRLHWVLWKGQYACRRDGQRAVERAPSGERGAAAGGEAAAAAHLLALHAAEPGDVAAAALEQSLRGAAVGWRETQPRRGVGGPRCLGHRPRKHLRALIQRAAPLESLSWLLTALQRLRHLLLVHRRHDSLSPALLGFSQRSSGTQVVGGQRSTQAGETVGSGQPAAHTCGTLHPVAVVSTLRRSSSSTSINAYECHRAESVSSKRFTHPQSRLPSRRNPSRRNPSRRNTSRCNTSSRQGAGLTEGGGRAELAGASRQAGQSNVEWGVQGMECRGGQQKHGWEIWVRRGQLGAGESRAGAGGAGEGSAAQRSSRRCQAPLAVEPLRSRASGSGAA